jgi:hypothetical protein
MAEAPQPQRTSRIRWPGAVYAYNLSCLPAPADRAPMTLEGGLPLTPMALALLVSSASISSTPPKSPAHRKPKAMQGNTLT